MIGPEGADQIRSGLRTALTAQDNRNARPQRSRIGDDSLGRIVHLDQHQPRVWPQHFGKGIRQPRQILIADARTCCGDQGGLWPKIGQSVDEMLRHVGRPSQTRAIMPSLDAVSSHGAAGKCAACPGLQRPPRQKPPVFRIVSRLQPRDWPARHHRRLTCLGGQERTGATPRPGAVFATGTRCFDPFF